MCQFSNNKRGLLIIENKIPMLHKVNVLFESINISGNLFNTLTKIGLISVTKMNVHIKGPVNVVNNYAKLNIIQFQSCDNLFSGEIKFHRNTCPQVISLDSYLHKSYGICKHQFCQ